jgi:diguanylate cyclase (GGDEF)-like protein
MHLLSIPCIAMALVNFYVGTYYLYFYSKRPQIKEHLPFALLCLSVGFYDVFSAGLYNSLSINSGVFWQRLQLDSGVVISVFLIWFTSVFIQQDRNRIIQFSIAYFIVILMASFFAGPKLTLSTLYPAIKNINLFHGLSITYYEGVVGPIYQIEIFSIVIVYLYFIYHFIRYYQRTKSRTLLILLVCVATYFIAVANDSLVAMRYYSFIYISEYSFFFIVIAMAYTLLDRFVNLYAAFEELNINLEHKVYERTSEINNLNENLRRLVDRDGLTGVYNRRFFNEYFEIEVRRAMNFLEHKTPRMPNQENDMNFGLAMIDIDFFKRINDTCGHLAGDDVLKQVTEIMQRDIFSRDVLCRYGGDEFALLLTKTSKNGILQAAEKIRKEIDEHAFVFATDHECHHVTISMGLVTFDEVLNKSGEEILNLADDRLLRAKSSGKNRIVFDDDP